MAKAASASGIVIIKKYANRRLYNTETSSYITLEHLAAMTREGREFKVLDARSDDDITHAVLTQIIMDEETRGQTLLPVSFLRQLIALYGDSMQSMVPQYLEASMEAFRRNQAQFRSAMEGAFTGGPFAEIAKRNMEMFEAAAGAFKQNGGVMPGIPGMPMMPGMPGQPAATAPPAQGPASAPAGGSEEIASLKAQLASLQDKIEKMAK
jgi:polyhydroxyalkanoate synthesis repressor PhaR